MSFSGWQLRAACHVLRRDGVIAYPTEAVYGLGCEPRSLAAVERLLALKGRPMHKGLILIAAETDQLDDYVAWDAIPHERLHVIRGSWPGPFTWLLPAGRGAPAWITGEHASIAVRVTAHDPVRELCRAWGGALVSTSANPAGRPPARTPLAVQRAFGNGVDWVLHAALGGLPRPTEIRDGLSGALVRPA